MSLALYRTYRPGRFADVVGQDHVTGPLQRAIEKNRVHHAYLFSGPRGCGKTSSARILARSLNCEKGPTPDPCGVCDSCVELAPNGPGSLDVIELDAATHGLVDDARDLRERAHFAPVAARFKIYIIDEAHQLGPGAANALLKIIEEPPPHVKFVFATTSPDKLLPTIRSRTHHYPFRLVPARLLQRHLAWVCEQEGVPADTAALDLVARAGAGSVRDSLSVLGQLIAGADDAGVTYELAYDQLGFTDAALLDGIVTALATDDAGGVFHAVDRIIESGHDPRRFLTDLLERLRDLVLVQTVPDALESGLVAAPDDQAARMREQAAAFGRSDLVRLATVADEGIVAMRGTTPTRLQLELVCARLLLPGVADDLSDVQARLDRMERAITRGGAAPAAAAAVVTAPAAPAPATPAPATPAPVAGAPTDAGVPRRPSSPRGPDPQPPAGRPSLPPAAEAAPAVARPAAAAAPPPSDEVGLAEVRRAWPEVLERLRELRKTPWTFIKDNTEPIGVTADVLTLGVRSPRLRDMFAERDDYSGYLQQALVDTLGRRWRVDAVVQPGAQATAAAPAAAGRSRPAAPAPSAAPAAAEAGVDPDDQVLDDVSGADLLSRELGASVIEVVDEA